VADLEAYPDTTRQRDLEQISAEAGRALLRVGGVMGTDDELEDATRAFGRHALALNLLAAYLRDVPGHSIAQAYAIPDVDVPEAAGKHPRRVMAAFAARFGDGPEVELLRVLGLFDRPAGGDEIVALRAEPPIPGLTEHLQELSEAEWLRLLGELRHCGLVAPGSHHRPDALDAHPLVREHFGAELQREYRDAWREGHNRLYEHLKATAKEYPDTLEEMAPLYAAMVHGCRAGRYQEALDEVYRRRIQRGNEAFNTHQLGAIGAELAMLSGFFDPPWRQPVAGLSEDVKGYVLNEAGFDLWSLGRLREAAQTMQAGLDAAIESEVWRNAGQAATNLSGLFLSVGDVPRAVDSAQQSVDFVDRSNEAPWKSAYRTALADALHQAGQVEEAEAAFREAEALQKEQQPEYPFLYAIQGYRYCDLLLGQEKVEEVKRRADFGLEVSRKAGLSLLAIALDHLSLGRAHLLQALQEDSGDYTQAATHLDQAVDGLRAAGMQDELPHGLLARAALRRASGDFDRARADLDEATTIAERGGMRLHQADCHLEYARLYLAVGEEDQAREHLAVAKAMIEEMGYHRRDGEVGELEEALRGA
jgi:tetratricopeptide (TPR) repeat protein